MARVSISVTEELKLLVAEQPDELGLDPRLSQSRRWAALVEAGVRARRAAHRDAVRRKAYSAIAEDPDHVESVGALSDVAFGHSHTGQSGRTN